MFCYDCVIVCGSTASVPATADLMEAIANNKNGKIILSGRIDGKKEDFELDTNPYHAEYEFLKRLGIDAQDVKTVNVGQSKVMGVMNIAFSNTGQHIHDELENVKLIECVRESEENGDKDFKLKYSQSDYNLFDMLVKFIDENPEFIFQPKFVIENEDDIDIWQSIKNVSEILCSNGIVLNVFDARAIVADAIGSITVRPNKTENCKVCVIGTIESRMQTADVIILTGLNEGMFPSVGYENAWLPRNIAKKIGLPSQNRKVSLMALDFMNLSCGSEVYWLRSKQSGELAI